MAMTLGSITVTLDVLDDGSLDVNITTEGTLQYVTAMGMLEMAKESLDTLLNDED